MCITDAVRFNDMRVLVILMGSSLILLLASFCWSSSETKIVRKYLPFRAPVPVPLPDTGDHHHYHTYRYSHLSTGNLVRQR